MHRLKRLIREGIAYDRTMHLAALFSGGKDSTYATMVMEQQGHDVPILLSVYPDDRHSMMFHTPNIRLVAQSADAMGKTLLHRSADKEGELDALKKLIAMARDRGCEGIVTGAIQSDYQFTRIDGLCHGLGLKCYSPLWRKSQGMIIRDVVRSGIKAIVVATAAEGLGREFLGRNVDDSFIREMESLGRRSGVSVCGEGGEYETLVLDSPLHRESLLIKEYSMEATASTSIMLISKLEKSKKFGR